MRVLVGAFGDPGHAFPAIALARALHERGHAVCVQTWERWREGVEAEGITFAAAPEYHVFPTRERPLKPYEAVTRATVDTRPLIREWAPDVVVADILTLAPALAAERGLLVDMHCDESDDPLSRHVETLTFETQRLGLQGRVTGSHLTSMHSMDNYYVSKLLPLMAEAQVHVVANPLINITLQGRHDSYPKRRGMTRVPELMAHGVNVAFGQDCAMDPWYSLGSGDMLEVAHMGLHVGQMTSQTAMRQCFEAVTTNAAKVMQLKGYGLEAGCNADFVLLQARDVIEAIRLRATRLKVFKRGKLLAECPPATSRLTLPGRPASTSWIA